jgi:transcriptional coactivator p15 (PC4)
MAEDNNEQILFIIERARGEEVRFVTSIYKGRLYFSARVWYDPMDGSGKKLPTKSGINLPADVFPEFERGVLELRKALATTNARESAAIDVGG